VSVDAITLPNDTPAGHLAASIQRGEAPADRLRSAKLGLWFFIASESCLFAAFIAARYVTTGVQRPAELDQGLGLAITSILIASSLTAYLAESFARLHRYDRAQIFLWATVALGSLFLAGVALEFNEGLQHFPPSTAYGTAFFSLVSLHAFHVATGILALAVASNLVRLRRLETLGAWRIEAVVKYWHFVDLAWVVIFPTLYLVS
jgi:cytochrome c oxidase subunit 3